MPRTLDTSVFKSEYCRGGKQAEIPPAFVCNVNADEVHFEVYSMLPNLTDSGFAAPQSRQIHV